MSGCDIRLCLLFRPKTVHCSTKNAYTIEITFPAYVPCLAYCIHCNKCLVYCIHCVICLVYCIHCSTCLVYCIHCIICLVYCIHRIKCLIGCMHCIICLVYWMHYIICLVHYIHCIISLVYCIHCIICLVYCIQCIIKCQEFLDYFCLPPILSSRDKERTLIVYRVLLPDQTLFVALPPPSLFIVPCHIVFT